MSGEHRSEPGPGATGTEARRGLARRFQTGVRGLIVAVACCGVISWSARSLWESQHPAATAARGLRSGDAARRIRATREMWTAGQADPGLAIPPLIAALGDPETEVRIATIESLGAVAGVAAQGSSAGDVIRAAMTALARSLHDREPAVRVAAIPAMVRILASAGPSVPIDPRAAVDTIAAALDDRDEQVRQAAFDGLAICGLCCSVDPPTALVEALGHSSATDRANAVKALANFRCSLDPWLPFLLQSVERDEPEVVRACWTVFARDRPPAFSAAAIPALVSALGSGTRIVRTRAARALQPHARDPRAAVAIPALLVLLKEPIDRDRGGIESPPPWVAFGINDSLDPAELAARLLGQVAPGTASAGDVIAALVEVVRSGGLGRQQAAIEALGAFGPAAEPAIPTLIRTWRQGLAANGGRPFVDGSWAATALGRIAPGTSSADAAVAALSDALDSGSEATFYLRLAAADALRAFGARAAGAIPRLRALQADRDLGRSATAALEAIERARSGPSTGNGKP